MSKESEPLSEEKKLLIRLPKDLHREAKLLAYELNISMAQLCREGLESVLQVHRKKIKGKKAK